MQGRTGAAPATGRYYETRQVFQCSMFQDYFGPITRIAPFLRVDKINRFLARAAKNSRWKDRALARWSAWGFARPRRRKRFSGCAGWLLAGVRSGRLPIPRRSDSFYRLMADFKAGDGEALRSAHYQSATNRRRDEVSLWLAFPEFQPFHHYTSRRFVYSPLILGGIPF